MAKKANPMFAPKEFNAAGSIYMYGSETPRTFIVDVTTTEDIKGELLQQAVDRALERLPYYRWTIVRKKGLYYFADNDLPFVVAQSDEPRRVGGETTNYHNVDVIYHGATISFSMNHGFCDGLGLNRFIEATLYHYFCLKDGKEYPDEGIFTDSVPYDPSEVEDMFARELNVDKEELKKLKSTETRYRLPELEDKNNKGPRIYRMPLKIKTQDLLSWGKANGASPAAAITAIMIKAVAREQDVNADVIMGMLPYSLRRGLNTKTFKNCSSAVYLPATPDEARTMSAGELAAKLRQVMKPQMDEHTTLLKLAGLQMLLKIGQKAPTFFLKNKLLAVPENRPQDTFTTDYVGSLTTGEYSDQIVHVDYLNADAFKGSMGVLVSETAGYFHINVNQTFEDDHYYRAFCAILDELEIPYEKLPYGSYLNPEIELPAEQK